MNLRLGADGAMELGQFPQFLGDWFAAGHGPPCPPDRVRTRWLTRRRIRRLIGTGGYDPDGTQGPLQAAAALLREAGIAAAPPVTVADLDRQLGDIPGTDLPSLIARLSSDPGPMRFARHRHGSPATGRGNPCARREVARDCHRTAADSRRYHGHHGNRGRSAKARGANGSASQGHFSPAADIGVTRRVTDAIFCFEHRRG